VQLPLSLYGTSARYANALFVSASRSGELAAVQKDLTTVSSWLKDGVFAEYTKNPVISRADKTKDMVAISKGMTNCSRGFLAVLAENGRLRELGGVISTFDKLMAAQSGIVDAVVTSPFALSAAQAKSVEDSIKQGYLKKGQTLKMDLHTDESLLGGLQVQIGDQFLDLSSARELNNIHAHLS